MPPAGDPALPRGHAADDGRGPAARLVGVHKRYGGVRALTGVDLTLEPGRVHALVGENGAGKSTSLGIIAGRVIPDEGDVQLFGAPAPLGRPRELRAAGVAAIYQELTIVPQLTTQANLFLGAEASRAGVLCKREMAARLESLCTRLDVDIPVGVPAGSLSIARQQLLEILRAVVLEPRLILLDEPTASLAPHEREVLYGLVRRFREDGMAVGFVSHNLDEVLDLSDTVTVFRNGRVVETAPVGDWTRQRLIESMIGATSLHRLMGEQRRPEARDGTPALEVRGLRVGSKVSALDLDVGRGEILGLAGLVGSGRSTVLRALAGLDAATGSLRVDGKDHRWPKSPRSAHAAGLFLVPEDRRGAGLVMQRDGVENILLSSYGRVSRSGLLDRRRGHAEAEGFAAAVRFERSRLNEPVANLSGGNQQKIVLARAMCRRPVVLLADEPTRGIDVGAKADVMSTLRRLADDGMAIVVVSSELEELEELCDRVVVLAAGRLAGELRGPQATAANMVRLAFDAMSAAEEAA
jgi:ABC-type sugar transport system ATPase subunit